MALKYICEPDCVSDRCPAKPAHAKRRHRHTKTSIVPREPDINLAEWHRLMDLHLERYVAETRRHVSSHHKQSAAYWMEDFQTWLTREVAGGNVGNTDG